MSQKEVPNDLVDQVRDMVKRGYTRDEIARAILKGGVESEVESEDQDKERTRLESLYGSVWDTKELRRDFDVLQFQAPFVQVVRKSDRKVGLL